MTSAGLMMSGMIQKVGEDSSTRGVDRVFIRTQQVGELPIASTVVRMYKRAQINPHRHNTVANQTAFQLSSPVIAIAAQKESVSLLDTNRDPTPYLYLLRDRELAALKRLFETVGKSRERLISRWHERYAQYCGASRSLAEPEFHRIFGAELDGTIHALLAEDMVGFTAVVRSSGETLRCRETPFSELVVSMHLFEEIALEAFAGAAPLMLHTYQALDKLAHCKIIVLADAYFRAHNPFAHSTAASVEIKSETTPVESRSIFKGIVGSSPAMNRLYRKIEAAARTRGTVLIIGESGTGKELVARALHECSPNPEAPFVPLNCAALPRDLTESELFGYRRGAFSGAREGYLGLFRAADGGSLVLDDITEMGLELQAKLLRAIQERSVRPVGYTIEIPVDVKIIAATNQDPHVALETGRLRADLYYRLQANVLRVPSVRERDGDVAPLASHFLNFFNSKMERRMIGIGKDAIAAMNAYSWPGNVREIANTIESAFTFGRGPAIEATDLPSSIQTAVDARGEPNTSSVPTYAEVERELIARALVTSSGNRSEAAKLLEISRKKLYDKIAKYGLE
jgi:two-component system response regulator AtoC